MGQYDLYKVKSHPMELDQNEFETIISYGINVLDLTEKEFSYSYDDWLNFTKIAQKSNHPSPHEQENAKNFFNSMLDQLDNMPFEFHIVEKVFSSNSIIQQGLFITARIICVHHLSYLGVPNRYRDNTELKNKIVNNLRKYAAKGSLLDEYISTFNYHLTDRQQDASFMTPKEEAIHDQKERAILYQSQGYPNQSQGYLNQSQGYLNQSQGYLNQSQGYLNQSQGYPNQSQGYLNQSQGYLNQSQGYPNQSQGYPNQSQGYPNQSQGYPNHSQGYPNHSQGYPNHSQGYPNQWQSSFINQGQEDTSLDNTLSLLADENKFLENQLQSIVDKLKKIPGDLDKQTTYNGNLRKLNVSQIEKKRSELDGKEELLQQLNRQLQDKEVQLSYLRTQLTGRQDPQEPIEARTTKEQEQGLESPVPRVSIHKELVQISEILHTENWKSVDAGILSRMLSHSNSKYSQPARENQSLNTELEEINSQLVRSQKELNEKINFYNKLAIHLSNQLSSWAEKIQKADSQVQELEILLKDKDTQLDVLKAQLEQSQANMVTVETGMDGNCMYYAYGISLMYYLRFKNDEKLNDVIFNRLKLKEAEKKQLNRLLSETKSLFEQQDIELVIQPILGKATRNLAAQQQKVEFENDPLSTALFAAAKYEIDACFLKLIEDNSSCLRLRGLIKPSPVSPDFEQAEIYRIVGIKQHMETFVNDQLKNINENYLAQLKETRQKDGAVASQLQRQQILDTILQKKTIEFFTLEGSKYLNQYTHHLQTEGVWGTTDDLNLLNIALQNEKKERNADGLIKITSDLTLNMHIYKENRLAIQHTNMSPDLIINNVGDKHWNSIIPEAQLSPKQLSLSVKIEDQAGELVVEDQLPENSPDFSQSILSEARQESETLEAEKAYLSDPKFSITNHNLTACFLTLIKNNHSYSHLSKFTDKPENYQIAAPKENMLEFVSNELKNIKEEFQNQLSIFTLDGKKQTMNRVLQEKTITFLRLEDKEPAPESIVTEKPTQEIKHTEDEKTPLEQMKTQPDKVVREEQLPEKNPEIAEPQTVLSEEALQESKVLEAEKEELIVNSVNQEKISLEKAYLSDPKFSITNHNLIACFLTLIKNNHSYSHLSKFIDKPENYQIAAPKENMLEFISNELENIKEEFQNQLSIFTLDGKKQTMNRVLQEKTITFLRLEDKELAPESIAEEPGQEIKHREDEKTLLEQLKTQPDEVVREEQLPENSPDLSEPVLSVATPQPQVQKILKAANKQIIINLEKINQNEEFMSTSVFTNVQDNLITFIWERIHFEPTYSYLRSFIEKTAQNQIDLNNQKMIKFFEKEFANIESNFTKIVTKSASKDFEVKKQIMSIVLRQKVVQYFSELNRDKELLLSNEVLPTDECKQAMPKKSINQNKNSNNSPVPVSQAPSKQKSIRGSSSSFFGGKQTTSNKQTASAKQTIPGKKTDKRRKGRNTQANRGRGPGMS